MADSALQWPTSDQVSGIFSKLFGIFKVLYLDKGCQRGWPLSHPRLEYKGLLGELAGSSAHQDGKQQGGNEKEGWLGQTDDDRDGAEASANHHAAQTSPTDHDKRERGQLLHLWPRWKLFDFNWILTTLDYWVYQGAFAQVWVPSTFEGGPWVSQQKEREPKPLLLTMSKEREVNFSIFGQKKNDILALITWLLSVSCCMCSGLGPLNFWGRSLGEPTEGALKKNIFDCMRRSFVKNWWWQNLQKILWLFARFGD